MKKSLLAVILLLILPSMCPAQQKASVEDRIISATLKSLAKTYVTASDINKLKKDNIDNLSKMDDELFRKRYGSIYGVVKYLPPKFQVSYGISESMTREQAIKNIESLDKNKMCETIDAIPDPVIAKRFKDYLHNKKIELQNSDAFEQINKFWVDVLKKFSGHN